MRVCAECEGELEAAYRFCPWCAAPKRRKLVEDEAARLAAFLEVPGPPPRALDRLLAFLPPRG